MDQRILFVLSAIQTDVGLGLDTNELARAINLSPSRLRHLFKRENGMTIVRYQRKIRMEEARLLLSDTFLSVKEIMNRVGIHDNSHFTDEFKKTCGLTPSEYRLQTRASVHNLLTAP
jgi:AraC family transcriptional regulator of arabinose operon